jgi:hypothetical protein
MTTRRRQTVSDDIPLLQSGKLVVVPPSEGRADTSGGLQGDATANPPSQYLFEADAPAEYGFEDHLRREEQRGLNSPMPTRAGASPDSHAVRPASDRSQPTSLQLQQANSTLVHAIQQEAGLSSDQVARARAVLQRYAPQIAELNEDALIEEQLAQDVRDKVTCEDALKKRWGPDYARHVETVRRALELLGEEAEVDFLCARLPDGTALFNSPQAFLAFFDLARHIGADDESDRARCLAELGTAFTLADKELLKAQVPEQVADARDGANGRAIFNTASVVEWFLAVLKRQPRGAGSSPVPDLRAARLRELEGWMHANDARYWKDERVQTEYRDLLAQGVTRDAPSAPGGASEVDREIADIERLMRDPRSTYFRGPDAERLQRRYRELVDAKGRRG